MAPIIIGGVRRGTICTASEKVQKLAIINPNPNPFEGLGGQHHPRITFDKYHPGYFGKVGMRKVLGNRKFGDTANIGKLFAVAGEII